MARLLLGVSGGIAAYKALELARLATLAGHGVRVVMTETATRFVGAASFEGIVGAPVLISEFERDPMRGAFPGEEQAAHDPIGHLELAARCDAYLVAPASANTIAKLAAGAADSMLTTSFLACTAPRLVAPAMNDRMYADAATQANLRPSARARGRGDRAGGGASSPRAASSAAGACPTPSSCWPGSKRRCPPAKRPLGRAAGPGHRRRHPRADRPGALHRQPLQRPDGDRPRRCGRRARGRGDADRRQRRAARRRRASAASTSRPPPSSPRPPRRSSPHTHVLLMAAAPADFRVADPAEGKLKRSGSLELSLRADRGHPRRACRPPGGGADGRRLRRRARGRGGRAGPGQAAAQGRRPDRPQRRLRSGDRVRERAQRGHPDRRRERDRGPDRLQGRAIAEAILDEVDRLREKQSRPAG